MSHVAERRSVAHGLAYASVIRDEEKLIGSAAQRIAHSVDYAPATDLEQPLRDTVEARVRAAREDGAAAAG